jgi:hypothetical protein
MRKSRFSKRRKSRKRSRRSRRSRRSSSRQRRKRSSPRKLKRVSRKRISLRRSRSIGKSRTKRKSLKRKLILGALGAAGLATTGMVVKNLRTDYNKNFIYEEGGLISSSKPRFENITIPEEVFKVRGKTYLSDKKKITSPDIL